MDKYTKLTYVVKQATMQDVVLRELVTFLIDCIEGKHPPNDLVTPYWQSQDLISVKGFYINEEVIGHIWVTWFVRVIALTAKTMEINIATAQSHRKITPLFEYSDSLKSSIVPKITNEMVKRLGIPEQIDQEGITRLLAMVPQAA